MDEGADHEEPEHDAEEYVQEAQPEEVEEPEQPLEEHQPVQIEVSVVN